MDDKTKALLIVLAPLAFFLTGLFGIQIILPLIFWIIYKDKSTVCDTVGINVLNGQISWSIYIFVSFILCFVFIGFFVIIPIVILWLVFTIIHAVKVSDCDFNYEMLWTIPFISKKPYLPPVENIDPVEPTESSSQSDSQ